MSDERKRLRLCSRTTLMVVGAALVGTTFAICVVWALGDSQTQELRPGRVTQLTVKIGNRRVQTGIATLAINTERLRRIDLWGSTPAGTRLPIVVQPSPQPDAHAAKGEANNSVSSTGDAGGTDIAIPSATSAASEAVRTALRSQPDTQYKPAEGHGVQLLFTPFLNPSETIVRAAGIPVHDAQALAAIAARETGLNGGTLQIDTASGRHVALPLDGTGDPRYEATGSLGGIPITRVSKRPRVTVSFPDGEGASGQLAAALAALQAIDTTSTRSSPVVGVTGGLAPDGQVLAVDGVREKLWAAARAGIRGVIVPRGNAAETDLAPTTIRVVLVRDLAEAKSALRVLRGTAS